MMEVLCTSKTLVLTRAMAQTYQKMEFFKKIYSRLARIFWCEESLSKSHFYDPSMDATGILVLNCF
jgi:hypothetical protein